MLIHLQLIAVLALCSSGYRLKRGYEAYPHGFETIDLGRAEETTHTIRFPLPVRTVRVTKTVAVPVPVPFPIRRDVPIPVHVPKPVPVPVSYPVPVPHPVPVHLSQQGGAQQTSPVGLILYDAGRALRPSGYGTSAAGYDGYGSSTGSTGATIGHHQGSIGVVVGASYGVSAPAGVEGKYPGTVLSEPVGVNGYTNNAGSSHSGDNGHGAYSYQNYQSDGSPGGTSSGNDNFSITKSIEPNYDASAADTGANSIQSYEENGKGK